VQTGRSWENWTLDRQAPAQFREGGIPEVRGLGGAGGYIRSDGTFPVVLAEMLIGPLLGGWYPGYLPGWEQFPSLAEHLAVAGSGWAKRVQMCTFVLAISVVLHLAYA